MNKSSALFIVFLHLSAILFGWVLGQIASEITYWLYIFLVS